MLLSKKIAVNINLASCRFKQYAAAMLRRSGVDLTPEQFLLIDQLWNQGPMAQQAIADTMGKDKNSVTKLIDGLESKKLVERRKDTKDRRSNIVAPTPKAEKMKADAKEKGISLLDTVLEGIPEDELEAFLGTLDKLMKNMEV